MDAAWEDAGRNTPARKFAGFWCSLADDSDLRTKQYVYDYLKVLSPDLASNMSKVMDRTTPDAINRSLDAMEALGCEETFLVPSTCDIADIERLSELVANR